MSSYIFYIHFCHSCVNVWMSHLRGRRKSAAAFFFTFLGLFFLSFAGLYGADYGLWFIRGSIPICLPKAARLQTRAGNSWRWKPHLKPLNYRGSKGKTLFRRGALPSEGFGVCTFGHTTLRPPTQSKCTDSQGGWPQIRLWLSSVHSASEDKWEDFFCFPLGSFKSLHPTGFGNGELVPATSRIRSVAVAVTCLFLLVLGLARGCSSD